MGFVHNDETGSGLPPAVFTVRYISDATRTQLVDPKLRDEFALPLRDQERRNEEDSRTIPVIEKILPQDDSGFNRLTQADFVGEEIPLNAVAFDPRGDLNLVREQTDPRRSETGHAPGCSSVAEHLRHESRSIGRMPGVVECAATDHIHGTVNAGITTDMHTRDR
jgi:hypothetical protein